MVLNLPYGSMPYTQMKTDLKGDRKGERSIWVNGNWRVTFKFAGGNAQDINLEDYH